jgi:2-C-methyl-D-erythritol 4-phosphate cytidylyltransferase
MKKFAIIVAGGAGVRMGSAIPKQFLLLHNKPVLWYTLNAFLRAFSDLHVILVLPEAHFEKGHSIAGDLQATERVTLVKGGDTRFHSVQNGLQEVPSDAVVFVHDGVRCLITPELITQCYAQAVEKGSAIPAITATDSIRIVEGDTHKVANRDNIRIIQTPQTFLSNLLLPAFDKEYNPAFTDEATVVEASGLPVFLIEGDHNNIKITRAADLLLAERILDDRQ